MFRPMKIDCSSLKCATPILCTKYNNKYDVHVNFRAFVVAHRWWWWEVVVVVVVAFRRRLLRGGRRRRRRRRYRIRIHIRIIHRCLSGCQMRTRIRRLRYRRCRGSAADAMSQAFAGQRHGGGGGGIGYRLGLVGC